MKKGIMVFELASVVWLSTYCYGQLNYLIFILKNILISNNANVIYFNGLIKMFKMFHI